MRKYTVIASILLSFLSVLSGGHHESKAFPVVQQELFQTPHYIPLLENPPQIDVKAEMRSNLMIEAQVRDNSYQAFSAFLFINKVMSWATKWCRWTRPRSGPQVFGTNSETFDLEQRA